MALYVIGELKRHHPILRESRYRAVMACERSHVWAYRRGEQGSVLAAPPLSVPRRREKTQCTWRQEMKQRRRAELWQSRGDNEEQRRE